jgi:DNA helicase-2/ATP-dependent DNA helicase PcrA
MALEADTDIARLAAGVRRGSIIAAAGCGKTEQIARAVGVSEHRRLILTHTHAGVDALTRRLKKFHIASGKYRIDTIAGWCLRFAASLRFCVIPQLARPIGIRTVLKMAAANTLNRSL